MTFPALHNGAEATSKKSKNRAKASYMIDISDIITITVFGPRGEDMSRYSRSETPRARLDFFAALRGAPSGPPREATTVAVVTSVCTGLMRLSQSVGVELHHVACTRSVPRHAAELSARMYGARVLRGDRLEIEAGWDDWRLVPLGYEMTRGSALVEGVRLTSGRMVVSLVGSASPSSFGRNLHRSLESARFDVALTSGKAMARRYRAGLTVEVSPRYAGNAREDDWERAEHLYLFDPWRDLTRLAVLACAAAGDDPGADGRKASANPHKGNRSGRKQANEH